MANIQIDTESNAYKELLVASKALEATGYKSRLSKLQAEKLEVFNRLFEYLREESIVQAVE